MIDFISYIFKRFMAGLAVGVLIVFGAILIKDNHQTLDHLQSIDQHLCVLIDQSHGKDYR